jgi:hypothetical protein
MEGYIRMTLDMNGEPEILLLCLDVPADWKFPIKNGKFLARPPTGRGRTFQLAFNQLARELPIVQRWLDAFVAKHAMSADQKAEFIRKFIRMMKDRRSELQSFTDGKNKYDRVLFEAKRPEASQ